MSIVIDETSIGAVMDLVPNTMFFLKDKSQRYISSNAEHSHICGARNGQDIIGYTAHDFFCETLVNRYDQMDQNVLEGQNYYDRLDFLHEKNGNPIWTLFTRTRASTKTGRTLIMGLSRKLPTFRNSNKAYQRLYFATEWISKNFNKKLSLGELAKRMNCSASQINRDFVQVLDMTPSTYQARLKIEHIKSQLETKTPLAQIAYDCGFSEQSNLSRFFKKHSNMTLRQYRCAFSIG